MLGRGIEPRAPATVAIYSLMASENFTTKPPKRHVHRLKQTIYESAAAREQQSSILICKLQREQRAVVMLTGYVYSWHQHLLQYALQTQAAVISPTSTPAVDQACVLAPDKELPCVLPLNARDLLVSAVFPATGSYIV